MSGIHPSLSDGPVTCDVVEAVAAGQLVEYRAASAGATQRCVGVAAAASQKVAGVALLDAAPTAGTANPLIAWPLPIATAVAREGEVPQVTYAAAANYGDKLKAAAAGAVTPWVFGTDNPALIIGECPVVAGVGSAAKGPIRLLGLS